MQCRLRDQRSRTFNVGFRPCRLHVESSPDSVNLLIILWTVDDEIPKFPAMECWETLFLNGFLCSGSQSRDPRPIFALWTAEPSEDAPFKPNHDTHLFPIDPFTCGMFQTDVLWAFINFLSLLLPLSQPFLKCVAGTHFKISKYLHKNNKVDQFEQWMPCLCSVINWI